jgi:hypothetical protein
VKARSFLGRIHSAVAETVDATKQRYGTRETLALLHGIDRIVAAKGKKIDVLNLKEKPDEAAILALLLGPTGKLRAPAAKVGKTLLVGFNDEAYDEALM